MQKSLGLGWQYDSTVFPRHSYRYKIVVVVIKLLSMLGLLTWAWSAYGGYYNTSININHDSVNWLNYEKYVDLRNKNGIH